MAEEKDKVEAPPKPPNTFESDFHRLDLIPTQLVIPQRPLFALFWANQWLVDLGFAENVDDIFTMECVAMGLEDVVDKIRRQDGDFESHFRTRVVVGYILLDRITAASTVDTFAGYVNAPYLTDARQPGKTGETHRKRCEFLVAKRRAYVEEVLARAKKGKIVVPSKKLVLPGIEEKP